MNNDSSTTFPWQVTASKLIEFSSKFKNTRDDFERQVGYLLLDVGVETLFKAFLSIPNIGAKLTDDERQKRLESIKGVVEKNKVSSPKINARDFDKIKFHQLLEAVRDAAGSKVTIENLNKAKYFHDIRNNIYHQGDGIAPTQNNFDEYLALAQLLLKQLFGIEDKEHTVQDEHGKLIDLDVYLLEYEFGKKEDLEELRFDLAVTTELYRPQYTNKIFEKKFKEIWPQFPDDQDDTITERSAAQIKRREKFVELTGKDVTNPDLIDEILQDIACLHIAVLINQGVLDESDYPAYFDFKEFAKSPVLSYNEITLDKVIKGRELMGWCYKTKKKLSAWIETKLSKK